MEQPAKPRSRRKRFLIVFVCLSVSGLVILHVTVRTLAFNAELTLIETVKAKGVHVFGDGQAVEWGLSDRLEALFHNLPYGVRFPESTTDADLECLSDMAWLTDVRVDQTLVTRAGLRLLAHIPSLEILFINDSRITASDLSILQDFPHLKSIWVSFDQCTEAGIQGLSRIKRVDFALMCLKCKLVDSVSPSRVFSIEEQIRREVAYHAETCEKRQEERASKGGSLR